MAVAFVESPNFVVVSFHNGFWLSDEAMSELDGKPQLTNNGAQYNSTANSLTLWRDQNFQWASVLSWALIPVLQERLRELDVPDLKLSFMGFVILVKPEGPAEVEALAYEEPRHDELHELAGREGPETAETEPSSGSFNPHVGQPIRGGDDRLIYPPAV